MIAEELMLNAKYKNVRARMAEFLASDAKAPQVAIHVDARPQSTGYEFLNPGNGLSRLRALQHLNKSG